jgi:hypothetical protein
VSDFWYRFGYDHVGVLYAGFVDWLRGRLQADGVERAFFVARDGWMIQQIYDRLIAEGGGPPSAYLYGSRRAFDAAARSPDEREAMLGHLRAIGLQDCARAGIVDLGWDGALQSSLERLLESAGAGARLSGYQLGTFPRAHGVANGARVAAYLCEDGEPARYHDVLAACVALFEFAFLAPHGSVVRLQDQGGAFEPVLAPHDVDPEDRRKAERLQEGALSFVDDWLRGARAPISHEEEVGPMERVLTRPTRLEARRLGDVRHAEGSSARRPIARPPTLGALLGNPLAIVDGLGESFWREGYKTRLMGSNPVVRGFLDLAARKLRIKRF